MKSVGNPHPNPLPTGEGISTESPFRRLPSVDRLLREAALARAVWPRALVVEAVRATLAASRERLAEGRNLPSVGDLVAETIERLERQISPSLRRVVNATGVILHTNLGRAPVSEAAARAMAEASTGYSNLEFDLETGQRGSRASHLRTLLCELTGAEDGFAVNNNAGAVLLALSALASGQEVIVSRGQAVEIGGGFRIPDVMRQSGARLVEVGTTNRTYLSDYEAAISPETALLLRVHPSNFRLSGFVHSVEISELVALAERTGLAVLDDVGSGALLDPGTYGLAHEPLVQESVRSGVSVVCFSGDKLLGGPQAGLLVGKRRALEAIRRHPLARALRIDKADLAGLEATLRHYQRGEATTEIPVWRMIATPVTVLESRARQIVAALESPRVQVATMRSTVGGGSLPEETLPSSGLTIQPVENRPGQSANELIARLRQHNPPVIARAERDLVWLDLRTVGPRDDTIVREAIRTVLG